MTKSDFKIRPATQKDVEDWYGKTPLLSMRAIAGELEGKVVAIGGVYRDKGAIVGIAGLKEEMRPRLRDIARMVKEGKKIIQDYPVVVAFADKNEPTADSFIRHLGFEHCGSHELGEVYVCQQK